MGCSAILYIRFILSKKFLSALLAVFMPNEKSGTQKLKKTAMRTNRSFPPFQISRWFYAFLLKRWDSETQGKRGARSSAALPGVRRCGSSDS